MRVGLALASVLLWLVACDSDGVTPVCSDAATSCTGTAVARDAQAADESDLVADDDAALIEDGAEDSGEPAAEAESDAEPADGT